MIRRGLLLSATLLLGLVGGMGIGGRVTVAYYEKVLASNWADEAVGFADTAAEIDAGDSSNAREMARHRLQVLIEEVAQTMKPPQAQEHVLYLKKISTYLDASPGMNLSGEVSRFLAGFPPYKGRDLETEKCDFGVCKLAKEKAGMGRLGQ